MRVYLCGPINGCTDSEASDWREAVKTHFPSALDPMRRDYRGREQANYREIVERDKRDIDQCDVVLVNFLGSKVISQGTLVEIGYAKARGKTIVVVKEPNNVHNSVFVSETASAIVDNLEDAAAIVSSLLSTGV